MKKAKTSIILIILSLLLPIGAFAANINSTSYKQSVIVSAGGENVTSSSYNMNLVIGIINRIINSSSYINQLGFFHTLLLANDQPCTSAGQCEGGYCCSSLCKSSACPSQSPSPSSSSSSSGSSAGGGGGGGGGPLPTPTEKPKTKDFSLSPGSIKEKMSLGAAKTISIRIKNTGGAKLKFDLDTASVSSMVFLSDTSFSLDAGEEKTVEANIIGKNLGSHIGEIAVSGDEIKKSISLVVDVESEQVLFDVKMDIPSGYKEVQPGSDLKSQITLLNVGPPKKVDVTVTYIIKDRHGNVIYEASETFAVENQTSFVKSFKIPKDLKPGEYIAVTEARYENSFAVSSELFKVLPKEETYAQKAAKSGTALAFALAVFIGMVFLFVYLLAPKIKIFKMLKKPRFKKTRKRKPA